MASSPTDGLRSLSGREVDAALARMRTGGDPSEIAYFGACRALSTWHRDIPADAGLDAFEAAAYWAPWRGAEEALEAAGYGHLNVDDFYDEISQAEADNIAAMMFEGGGSEDYRAAQSFLNAATSPPPDRRTSDRAPTSVRLPCASVRHRRASGRRPVHRRGSRRSASSGDPDDGESEPPRLRLWRHPFGSSSGNSLHVLISGTGL